MPYLEGYLGDGSYMGQGDVNLVWQGGVPVPTDVAPPGTAPAPDFGLCPDGSPATSVGCSASSTEEQPVTPTDGTYTLPVQIFNGVLPPIVIQTGGAPTISSPIPTTLPSVTTAPVPAPGTSNTGLYIALAALAAIAFMPSKKRR